MGKYSYRLVSYRYLVNVQVGSMELYSRAGAHQMEPPSPIQALGVNPFPSRFIIRTVPREDFARRRWEEPITTTNSSKSSAERLIVDSFQGACLNVGFMTAKKKNTRKDNLSLPLSHRFMLSLSKVIH